MNKKKCESCTLNQSVTIDWVDTDLVSQVVEEAFAQDLIGSKTTKREMGKFI
jgi:hypothetical protein